MGKTKCHKEMIRRKWSPRELWTPAMILMTSMMIIKLLLFDVLWLMDTSWKELIDVRLYVHVILLSFILSVPMGMFRRKWLQVAVLAVMDIELVTVLCYRDGGLTGISFISRMLTGALPETMPGAPHSFAWSYLLLSLTTLAAIIVCLIYQGRTPVPLQGKMQYCGYLLMWSITAWLLT